MAITAAEIESNGWVLALTFAGSLTSPATDFGAYSMDPDGAPRVALALSSPGFVKSGGTAIAGNLARALVGTRPLRLPIDPANPSVQALDETDLGGGSIRVRIALSEEVYTGDTGLSLAVLADWRAGEAAQSGISVTNNSTLAPPLPIMRWVLPPYDVTAGTFRVSLIVGTVNPVGFEPVAGVKFTATNGTTTKTVWATELSTDNSFGDNLRCYTVEIDPAEAPALTAGLLRIDAEVYPWVGAMRTTDPAGTKVLTTLRTDGYKTTAAAPWVIGYDPAGTRYGQQWVFVDQVNGTVTASAAMVATTLAGAKAVTPASRARNVSTAIQALGLQNRTLAAANGLASATKSVDGAKIVLAAGTHVTLGTTAVGTGLNAVEIPLHVIGDPDDSNPRVNCILENGSASSNTRALRIRWRNLTVAMGGSAALNSGTTYNFLDNVEVRGRTGSESVSTNPIGSSAAPAGQINNHLTKTRVWRTAYAIGAAGRQTGLLRACEFSRRATAINFVKNRWISKAEDTFNGANAAEGMGPVSQTTDLAAFEDLVVAYNDMRSIRWGVWNAATAATGTLAGISPQTVSQRRHLILNNLFERISLTEGVSDTSDAFTGYGEASYAILDTIVIEGNTFVGAGYNAFYSDPTPATLADVNSQTNITRRIRHANNATDRNASKHDDFSDPTTSSIRTANGLGALGGYRPACIGAWSVHFGVGMEGHVDFSRSGSVNFRRDGGSGFVGLRGTQFPFAAPGNPGFTDDRSESGTDLGGGNYIPATGSPLLGRITRGNSDRDFAGNARTLNGASGALEAAAPGGVTALADIAAGGAIAIGISRAAAASVAVVAGAGLALTAAAGIGAAANLAGGGTLRAALAAGISIAVSVDAGGGASVLVSTERATVQVSNLLLSGGAALSIQAVRSLVQTPIIRAGGALALITSTAARGLMTADLPPDRIIKSAAVTTITFGRGGRPS